MNREALVTFFWRGAPAAIMGPHVSALLDDPAIASLPMPLGQIKNIVAYESNLFPLLDDPELPEDHTGFTTVIVVRADCGNLALRVDANIKVQHGSVEESFVQFDTGQTALLLDPDEILTESLDPD